MDYGLIAAVTVFILTYALIISERIDRSTVAMAGAAAMVLLGIIFDYFSQEEVITAIDWNTIGLLLGMMLIVGILEETGLFEALAVYAAKVSRGNYYYMIVLFSVLTAIGSMTIDNVTTVLLVAPVSLRICDDLGVDAKPVLLMEATFANIGGVGTLVGDPPNIIIGSAAGLTYVNFLYNLLPVVLLSMVLTLIAFRYYLSDKIEEANETIRERTTENSILDHEPREQVKNWGLLYRSLGVLVLVTVGFALQGITGLEPATVALAGASLLLLIANQDMEEMVSRVEWTTLLFFAGLFVVVDGIAKTGVLTTVAKAIASLSTSHYSASIVVLLLSAVGSGIVDNIPFTAAMIPVINSMNSQLGLHGNELWWALAMGAGFGGNATYIGSSATVVAVKISERHGDPITFRYWLRYGTVIMLVTVFTGILDLTVRFFLLPKFA
ncbi:MULTISPECIES: ArsB/NhaD family transporter [unclassified Haladaptatus]|uniref:ArsB/NhaD family transporter n=1 Tax=unclassified Haladaptatus TaxID=2622732 RepID=UPI00209C3577|nr:MULTISPECIES: ArsB/NhaD family transporter [unclassified Haladaptatus]MCO8246979.1 ArsB/NhaD family transporter [Haladaptatus sp. AB643]MCO8254638.1 ArsB/NhaD family transporter [Haladaptatus sp. AB618]